jgi:hypothetical protein
MEPSNTTSLVYNYWPCYIAIYMKLTRCSQNIPKNDIGQPLIYLKYYIIHYFGNTINYKLDLPKINKDRINAIKINHINEIQFI